MRLAMMAAVASVYGLAWLDQRRNYEHALADFSVLPPALADSAARAVAARLQGVAADLGTARAIGADVPRAELESLLRGIVARSGDAARYREADWIAGDAGPSAAGVAAPEKARAPGGVAAPAGASQVEVPAQPELAIARAPALVAARRRLLAELARAPEGQVVAAPIATQAAGTDAAGGAASGPVQLYGMRGRAGAVVLAVDVLRLFDDVGGVARAGPLRGLAFSRSGGQGILFGEGAPRWIEGEGALGGALSALGGRLAGEEPGFVKISGADAAALGLPDGDAVVGHSRVRIAGLDDWSVALASSTQGVRNRSRLGALRLAIATGVAALLVGLFGAVLSRQERRERGLAEQLRLAATTAALRERSEKIVENIPVGVLALALGAEGERVSAVNPYLAQRGVTAGGDLSVALPRAGADELASLRALIVEAKAAGRPCEHVGLQLHLGGEQVCEVDADAVPLAQPLPDASCFLLLHDRTALRALQRTVMRAEKLATIGTLAAGVAHEVGTPLGIISGRAEQLLSRLPEGPEGETHRRGLASILVQVERVSSTIRQLLDFARQRPVETKAVAPAGVLECAAELLGHRFRHAGVQLRTWSSSGLPQAAADPGQLEQALVNLLINACDACREGGTVTARAVARGDRVAFEVSDDGIGIPPEHLPHVLDPFFTTKKRGQGTGLGLSIVADIVKNHGGTLEIDSVPNRGTTVRVLLPMAAAQEGIQC